MSAFHIYISLQLEIYIHNHLKSWTLSSSMICGSLASHIQRCAYIYTYDIYDNFKFYNDTIIITWAYAGLARRYAHISCGCHLFITLLGAPVTLSYLWKSIDIRLYNTNRWVQMLTCRSYTPYISQNVSTRFRIERNPKCINLSTWVYIIHHKKNSNHYY